MRPIGALVLGAYVDRRGRRAGLLMTLGLMALGTLSIACTPGYATLGLLAPIIVLIGRLLQGLSAGAQVGSASVYLSEIATPGHKGFYVSWQSASQQMAVVFAALLGIAVRLQLRCLLPSFSRWGWRVPFLAGCLLIPFLFIIRNSAGRDSQARFRARAHHHLSTSAIFASLARNWRIIALGTMLRYD